MRAYNSGMSRVIVIGVLSKLFSFTQVATDASRVVVWVHDGGSYGDL
jgi:hypothetical protein